MPTNLHPQRTTWTLPEGTRAERIARHQKAQAFEREKLRALLRRMGWERSAYPLEEEWCLRLRGGGHARCFVPRSVVLSGFRMCEYDLEACLMEIVKHDRAGQQAAKCAFVTQLRLK